MSPLSNEEKSFLLRLARQALSQVLSDSAEKPDSAEKERRRSSAIGADALVEQLGADAAQLTPVLKQPAGVFTTLHKNGALRGCVGFAEPRLPLYRAAIETAIAAALRDPRFPPVRAEELPALDIELSVLSPAQPVPLPPATEIQIGVHGLIVTQGHSRGLLLPQVAAERGWSAERFLEETCRKAGLPLDAWRHGARAEVFHAEVFGEK